MISLGNWGIRPTLDQLRQKCVKGKTHKQYFAAYKAEVQRQVNDFLKNGGNIQALLDPAGSPSLEKALAGINRYPGKLEATNPDPKPGVTRHSAFFHRIAKGGQEVLRVSETEERPLTSEVKQQVLQAICEGKRGTHLIVGGLGTRLGIMGRPKFSMTPSELANRHNEVYKTSESLAQPSQEWTVGERLMLSLAYGIGQAAKEVGMEPEQALANQNLFIVASGDDVEMIVDTLKSWNFFGFDSKRVLFMSGTPYKNVAIDRTGTVYETENMGIHNHGPAMLQAYMEEAWFTVGENGKQIPVSREEYINIMSGNNSKVRAGLPKMESLLVAPIEDMSIELNPYDIGQMAIALGQWLPRELQKEGSFGMTMTHVGQKEENPQKGGLLITDPSYHDSGSIISKLLTAYICIEAFQAMPEYHHYVKQLAHEAHQKIKYLNLNMNTYDPKQMAELLTGQGLPVWLGAAKSGGMRNECPSGDMNYFLRTIHTALFRLIDGKLERPVIQNLKDPQDIKQALDIMRQQELLPGFMDFARSMAPADSTRRTGSITIVELRQALQLSAADAIRQLGTGAKVLAEFKQLNPKNLQDLHSNNPADWADILRLLTWQVHSQGPFALEARPFVEALTQDPVVKDLAVAKSFDTRRLAEVVDREAAFVVLQARLDFAGESQVQLGAALEAILMPAAREEASQCDQLLRQALNGNQEATEALFINIRENKLDFTDSRAIMVLLTKRAIEGDVLASTIIKSFKGLEFTLKAIIPNGRYEETQHQVATNLEMIASGDLNVRDLESARDILWALAAYPHQHQAAAQNAFAALFPREPVPPVLEANTQASLAVDLEVVEESAPARKIHVGRNANDLGATPSFLSRIFGAPVTTPAQQAMAAEKAKGEKPVSLVLEIAAGERKLLQGAGTHESEAYWRIEQKGRTIIILNGEAIVRSPEAKTAAVALIRRYQLKFHRAGEKAALERILGKETVAALNAEDWNV